MISPVNLDFHETFAPEREHLSKLLSLTNDPRLLTKEEIFELTSIPTGEYSGKVVPHIRYAEYMGLIKSELQNKAFLLSATELGKIIIGEDPYLFDNPTQLVAHYNLTSLFGGAPLWSFIFRRCMISLGKRFTDERVNTVITKHFGKNKVNLTPVRSCYKNDSAFATLNLISFKNNVWEFVMHKPKKTLGYLYGYTLLKDWETCYGRRMEITLNELTDELAWNLAYGWDNKTTLDVLDILMDLGIVNLNKQLIPIIIIRKASSAEVLNKIYSLMF